MDHFNSFRHLYVCILCLLMIRRPPRATRPDPLFPYTTLFRPCQAAATGHRSVLTLGCDMPFLDEALLVRLTVPGPGRYVAEAPVIGHWPTTLAEPLLRDRKSTRLNSSH